MLLKGGLPADTYRLHSTSYRDITVPASETHSKTLSKYVEMGFCQTGKIDQVTAQVISLGSAATQHFN